MPIENVQLVVTGTNPQTINAQVNISTSGSGTVSLAYSGAGAGVDTVTALLPSKSLTSNAAQVTWQGTNGLIATTPVSTFVRGGAGTGLFPPGILASAFSSGPVVNSLMFNTSNQSGFPGYTEAGNTAQPIQNNGITASAYYSGSDTPIPGATGSCDMVFIGSFVVRQAGVVSFSAYVNSAFVIGVSGASFVNGSNALGGVTTTPIKGYPTLAGYNGSNRPSWPGGDYAVETFILNFPAPGVYPYEIVFTASTFTERQFDLLAQGAVIPPVSAITPPPSPTPGSGNFVLSPSSAGPEIVGTNQNFTLSITGITYVTKPYLPLLEGVASDLFIYNGPSSFTAPTMNGALVPAATIVSAFSLTGDNDSYRGRLGVQNNGGTPALHYNGNAFDPNVALTNLTITEDNVAWYNATTSALDLYTPTGSGGGVSVQIEVDYYIIPAISSISPSSVPADGQSHTFTVNFDKPIPPLQVASGLNLAVTGSGGLTYVSSAPVTNSSGWVTGFTIVATAQSSTSTQSASLSISLTSGASLTYLGATGITTGAVNYITSSLQSLTLTGVSTGGTTSSAPTLYSWAVTSAGASNPNTLGSSTTLQCVVASIYNTFGLGTFRVSQNAGAFVTVASNLSPSVATDGTHATYTFVLNTSIYASSSPVQFQFTETQTDGAILQYTDSTVYYGSYTSPQTGGGGCPTLDMFVDEHVRVAEIHVKTTLLDCLNEDFQTVTPHLVEAMTLDRARCFRLVTANGAEITVSESTPVATVEGLALIAAHRPEEVKNFAFEMVEGLTVFTDVGAGVESSRLIRVEDIGVRTVARVYVGERNFAAGRNASKRIFTHNSGVVVK